MAKKPKYEMDNGGNRIETDIGANDAVNRKLMSTDQPVNTTTLLKSDGELLDKAIERVFLIKPRSSHSVQPRSAVVMQDVETSITPEELEHVLFNRLLMAKSALLANVEQSSSPSADPSNALGNATEANPIVYLCESFLRLQALPPSSITVEQLAFMQRIIMQNIRTGLAVPDIFPDVPPASLQIVDFVFKHFDMQEIFVAALLELILFGSKDIEVAGDVDEILFPVFDELDNRVKLLNSRGPELVLSNVRALSPVFFLLSNVCRKTEGARSFMHFTKITAESGSSRYASACERTLLGRLLYASSFPVRTA